MQVAVVSCGVLRAKDEMPMGKSRDGVLRAKDEIIMGKSRDGVLQARC